jgi:hypothetical protein
MDIVLNLVQPVLPLWKFGVLVDQEQKCVAVDMVFQEIQVRIPKEKLH